MVDSHCD